MAKLTNEVRTRFTQESEISLTTANSLSYMLACLNESMRCYPPVAGVSPRITPKTGTVIAGQTVPGNVSCPFLQTGVLAIPDSHLDLGLFLMIYR